MASGECTKTTAGSTSASSKAERPTGEESIFSRMGPTTKGSSGKILPRLKTGSTSPMSSHTRGASGTTSSTGTPSRGEKITNSRGLSCTGQGRRGSTNGRLKTGSTYTMEHSMSKTSFTEKVAIKQHRHPARAEGKIRGSLRKRVERWVVWDLLFLKRNEVRGVLFERVPLGIWDGLQQPKHGGLQRGAEERASPWDRVDIQQRQGDEDHLGGRY